MEITVKLFTKDNASRNGMKISEDVFNEFLKNGNNKIVRFEGSESSSLGGAAGIIKETWREGDDMYGKIESIQTPNGKILGELIRAEAPILVSPEGYGTINEDGTIDDFTLTQLNIKLQ